ncbi:hypothetical protein GGX14DRAFT_586965, partial [Mycena pura]
MEFIRTKRASATGAAARGAGAAKSEYRKRSRATPPAARKCHSCQTRETPEWRRGPDGVRTLCNACGLQYVKLLRKRKKEANGGTAVKIDSETLRASASARANMAEKS